MLENTGPRACGLIVSAINHHVFHKTGVSKWLAEFSSHGASQRQNQEKAACVTYILVFSSDISASVQISEELVTKF